MKTFLLSIPKRLKLKDQEIDAQAALCDKPWTVFNDEGVKQLFIFQPDGTLLITTNGIVSNSTWKYISANRSIIITSENKSVMFHPAFLDDVVFALQQDGEGSSLFMIDENNTLSFSPRTLTELGVYFRDKEQQLIVAEQQKSEKERLEKEQKEAEGKQLEEEQCKGEDSCNTEREPYNPQKERAKAIAAESLLLGVPVFIGIVFIVFCLYLLMR